MEFNENDEITDNAQWNKTRAEYANTVLYSDYILQEIINRFHNDNAVLVYISDHGNDVYDDGKNFVGHSNEDIRSSHMVEIPMFIWGGIEILGDTPINARLDRSSCKQTFYD